MRTLVTLIAAALLTTAAFSAAQTLDPSKASNTDIVAGLKEA